MLVTATLRAADLGGDVAPEILARDDFDGVGEGGRGEHGRDGEGGEGGRKAHERSPDSLEGRRRVLCYNNSGRKTLGANCARSNVGATDCEEDVAMHAGHDGIAAFATGGASVEGACARSGLALTPLRQSVLGDPEREPCPARRLCDHRGAGAARGQGDRAAHRLPHARFLSRARLSAQASRAATLTRAAPISTMRMRARC